MHAHVHVCTCMCACMHGTDCMNGGRQKSRWHTSKIGSMHINLLRSHPSTSVSSLPIHTAETTLAAAMHPTTGQQGSTCSNHRPVGRAAADRGTRCELSE